MLKGNRMKKIKIVAELDIFEADSLAVLLSEKISEYRHQKAFDYAMGEITDEELSWFKEHAYLLEGIAKKLFPDWRIW